MSDQQQPWSDNPNAPQIPYDLYFAEKANFAGILIGAILYGMLIVLFFRCMWALMSPVNRRRHGNWRLVLYTAIMFSFATVFTAMNLNLQSISYIDNREFPGVAQTFPPGPLGYQWFIYSQPLTIITNLMFLLNNWLADGLLLYRCYYVIYSMNIWIIAFPCLMYLASVAMGILFIYQTSQPNSSIWDSDAIDFGLPYFCISVSLNVFLTLMIVTRLILHSRNIRAAMGPPGGFSGLYKAIITMLIESSVLYAVSSLLFIGPYAAGNHAADIFLPILAETQVIAPLLIIQRVADQSALMSTTIVSRNTAVINFERRRPGKSTVGSDTLDGGSAMDKHRQSNGELGVGGDYGQSTSG